MSPAGQVRRFTSAPVGPRERGREFGARFATEIAANVLAYEELFAGRGELAGLTATRTRTRVDATASGAWAQIERDAPELAQEIEGIADGARLEVGQVAALNARTEVLAALGAPARGECSTVVVPGAAGGPFAIQNWDWFGSLAGGWLVWTIPHPDGRTTTTLTEYGVVGKIGINRAGVGLLFNILHHADDGRGAGLPVHVAARRVLDGARSAAQGLAMLRAIRSAASTAITLVDDGGAAVTAEVWPGGVEAIEPTDGLLLHTNHFLAPAPAAGDLEPTSEPDTLTRMAALRRRLGARPVVREAVEAALCDHGEGPLSLCCHPDPAEPAAGQYATLATVRLDFGRRALDVTAGNPCTHREAPLLARPRSTT